MPDRLLNKTQLKVKECTISNTVFFDADGAASDLAAHGFPAYFLDFETIQFAIPIWKGTRPYQQIPFQFSLHTFTASGELTHEAFLDLSGKNPAEDFAKALVAKCGETGPVFVYNNAFEKTRIAELAKWCPDLAQPLLAINARIVDLLPVTQKRYYHPLQQGSWSIKAVLPTAVPELSYGSLDGVQDGTAAMSAFLEGIDENTTAERKSEITRQLLAYCHLDTLAMVRLWRFFTGHKPV